ncbi:hypothetical protein [Parafrankia sp. EUN1f]|uniref:hypothetical protein n=1 Tax=Parafrankia sp. EUN1f TaxID=102897 RepID=UPI0001C4436D|nr:hypothetical protein [Parafrankia sp. EUN1f]EFC83027.1 hypothetical protein FrEUN1fDRAFT_3880 [Parafrankia sp. EUN1f]
MEPHPTGTTPDDVTSRHGVTNQRHGVTGPHDVTSPHDVTGRTSVTGRDGVPGRRGRVSARLLTRLWPTLLTGALLGAGGLGLAFLPALASSAPLLLIAMRPTVSVLLLVGGEVAFVPALLVATVFRASLDVGYFGLARHNVQSLLLRRVGTSRLVAALSRHRAQRGLLWFCLVNTNLAVDAALGTGSVPLRRFLRFVVPGSAISAALYLSAGSALAPWTQDLVRWLDDHAGMLILGGVAVAAVHTLALLINRRLHKGGTKGHNDQSGHQPA